MRAWPAFVESGVKLYTISYDDREALAAFASAHDVPYPMLSDADSAVIRRFGLLNDEVAPGYLALSGLPFPGSYVVSCAGGVSQISFHHFIVTRFPNHM